MGSVSEQHADIETTDRFRPRFDSSGLIPAIATDAATGTVVMFAWMNMEALQRTMQSGRAHYWSRSRQTLWLKGETSGNIQSVKEIRVDCDQDVLWLTVETAGDGANCHTGEKSCFYRRVEGDGLSGARLIFEDGSQL